MAKSISKIRDASGWTIFVFGVLALLLGLLGLIKPELTLSFLGFEIVERTQRVSGDFTVIFILASSMASFNMGVYYILAALNDVKIFYRWTVPFRALTFTVFITTVLLKIAPLPFIGVGLWELTGAIATGIALFMEKRGNQPKEE
ncbi:MAG: hypothetical protein L3J16_07735 [Anaerolineales bacterium]|nr:hypothetical protein [Anaerolineales bacterium]